MSVRIERAWSPLCRLVALALLVSTIASARAAAEPTVYAWVEAEDAVAMNADFAREGPRSELLSGGSWIRKSLSKGEAARAVPPEGFLLRYRLPVPEAGQYDLWARDRKSVV